MLDIDLDSARLFLRALAFGQDARESFMAWPEAETSSARPQSLEGTLAELADQLVASNRDGCGISVCVNETDGRGHRFENIERPRALFCDFDAGEPHPREFDGAQPSMWVVTPRGAHAYWLLQPDIIIAWERWADIQVALQRRFYAEKMPDRTKVLRVPGFWHWKGGASYRNLPPEELDPYQVMLGYVRDEMRYNPEDVVRAFALQVGVPATPAPSVDLGGCSYSDRTKRCRRFVDHCGPAVAGSGGYARTKGICGIGYDFGLEPDEYWPILADWNATCDPPWKEHELRRKLDRIFAVLRSGGTRKPFGHRLFEDRTPPQDLIRQGVMMPDVPWPDDDDAPVPKSRRLYVVHGAGRDDVPTAGDDAPGPARTIHKGPAEPPEDPWQRLEGEDAGQLAEPPESPPPTDADAPDDGSGGDPPDTLILDPQAPVRSARRFLAWRFMQNGLRTITHHIRSWWRWTGAAYTEVSREDIVHRVYVFTDPAMRYNDRGTLVPFNPDETKVNKIRHALESECHVDDSREPPCWLPAAGEGDKRPRPAPHEIVACRNGLLHLPTMDWLGRRPDYFTRTALEVSYNASAPPPVRWQQFLDELWPDDRQSQGLLQEWFGLTLVPDTSFQKLLLVVGPKRGGKGTIARILAALHGKSACAWPKMENLVDRFGLWPLLTATVAIMPDVRISHQLDTSAAIETILRITGEDAFQIDRKNLPILSGVRIPSRLMLMSNLPPRLADPGNAFASRCLTLHLEQTWIGKEDRHLERKLLSELPGILLWAIEGWKRLNLRGHFEQPQTGRALLQEIEDLSNPLGAFVRQRCELFEHPVVPYGLEEQWFSTNEEIFAAWKRWCETENRQAVGEKSTLIRNLRGNFPNLRPRRSDRVIAGKTVRPRGLVGIRVRYDEDVDEPAQTSIGGTDEF